MSYNFSGASDDEIRRLYHDATGGVRKGTLHDPHDDGMTTIGYSQMDFYGNKGWLNDLNNEDMGQRDRGIAQLYGKYNQRVHVNDDYIRDMHGSIIDEFHKRQNKGGGEPAPAPEPTPAPEKKPAPPIKHSQEMVQAKERAQSYQDTQNSGEATGDIYGGNQEQFGAESNKDNIFKSYDFSKKTYGE
jgi:hypothetical protein